MLDKLAEINVRFEKLTELLIQPETIGDQQLFRKLSQEHSELQEIVSAYRNYQKISQSLEDNLQIVEDDLEDLELKDLAREEIKELEELTPVEFGGVSKNGTVYNFKQKPIGQSDLIADAKLAIQNYDDVKEVYLSRQDLESRMFVPYVDQNILLPLKSGNNEMIKKTKKNTKPKLRFDESFIFLFITQCRVFKIVITY